MSVLVLGIYFKRGNGDSIILQPKPLTCLPADRRGFTGEYDLSNGWGLDGITRDALRELVGELIDNELLDWGEQLRERSNSRFAAGRRMKFH